MRDRRLRQRARRLGFTRNPLCGRLEWAEALMVLLTAVAAITLLVVSVRLGLTTYHRGCDRSAAERSAGQRIQVTLLETDSTGWSGVTRTPDPAEGARARWTTPTGPLRTARVFPATAASAGERVEIWLDAEGRPIPPPAIPATLAVDALGAGLGTGMIGGGAVFVLTFAVLTLIGRVRRARIGAEWAEVEARWTQRNVSGPGSTGGEPE